MILSKLLITFKVFDKVEESNNTAQSFGILECPLVLQAPTFFVNKKN
jgi:hypothetical protein